MIDQDKANAELVKQVFELLVPDTAEVYEARVKALTKQRDEYREAAKVAGCRWIGDGKHAALVLPITKSKAQLACVIESLAAEKAHAETKAALHNAERQRDEYRDTAFDTGCEWSWILGKPVLTLPASEALTKARAACEKLRNERDAESFILRAATRSHESTKRKLETVTEERDSSRRREGKLTNAAQAAGCSWRWGGGEVTLLLPKPTPAPVDDETVPVDLVDLAEEAACSVFSAEATREEGSQALRKWLHAELDARDAKRDAGLEKYVDVVIRKEPETPDADSEKRLNAAALAVCDAVGFTRDSSLRFCLAGALVALVKAGRA